MQMPRAILAAHFHFSILETRHSFKRGTSQLKTDFLTSDTHRPQRQHIDTYCFVPHCQRATVAQDDYANNKT